MSCRSWQTERTSQISGSREIWKLFFCSFTAIGASYFTILLRQANIQTNKPDKPCSCDLSRVTFAVLWQYIMAGWLTFCVMSDLGMCYWLCRRKHGATSMRKYKQSCRISPYLCVCVRACDLSECCPLYCTWRRAWVAWWSGWCPRFTRVLLSTLEICRELCNIILFTAFIAMLTCPLPPTTWKG